MTRIYIAGPMTGYERKNYPAFHAAAAKLRDHGHEVVSPAEIWPEDSACTWADAMRADIPALCTCQAIALLPGWENSEGARAELFIARLLAMDEIALPARADLLNPLEA